MSEEIQKIFKVIIAGPSKAGKTCLVQRLVDDVFLPDFTKTIGIDFSLKHISLANPDSSLDERIALQIWDMAGEDKFRALLPYYIAGTHGIFLVFDITDPKSFGELAEWLEVMKTYVPEDIPSILISAKNDLESRITDEIIKVFQERNKIAVYFETSSKTGENVNEAFQKITELIIEKTKND
ncbi:MAG: Rab family GTPase [Candidatus Hodarchaeales archaeon]|jgi:small GTP-binding protein